MPFFLEKKKYKKTRIIVKYYKRRLIDAPCKSYISRATRVIKQGKDRCYSPAYHLFRFNYCTPLPANVLIFQRETLDKFISSML